MCVTPMLRSLALLARYAAGGRRTSLNSFCGVLCQHVPEAHHVFARCKEGSAEDNMLADGDHCSLQHTQITWPNFLSGVQMGPATYRSYSSSENVVTTSAQWRGGRLAVLCKKKVGSAICYNSRGIFIGDHWGKLWNALLASHVSRRADSSLPQEQCGFMRGRGTSRASHLSTAFLSRCSRLGKPAGMLFLDLSKAFDKVVRETLTEVRGGEINIEAHLVGHVLTQAAAKHMATCISESGGLLRELGVPDVIVEFAVDRRLRGFITHPLVERSSRAKEHARAASSVPCCLTCSVGVCCVSFARRVPLLVYSLLSDTDMVLSRCRLSVMSTKIASFVQIQ